MADLLTRSSLLASRKLPLRAAVASVVLTFTIAPVLADACSPPIEAFNRAVNAGQDQAAQAQIERILSDANCGGYVIPAQRRLAASRLAAAQKLIAENRPLEDYAVLIADADRPGVLWQAAATLAEVRFGQRQFAEAARGFDRAIEIVKNETLTPNDPGRSAIERLLERAAAARLLAANIEPGQEGQGFVMTISATRDGRLGGIFSPRVRGVVPRVVPMPITFDYRSASLTAGGQQAALELARAIKEQRPANVVLVGHTDVRGGADYNKKLSIARAEAVAAFLHENSVDVPVEPEGVGADEPLHLSDATGLSQDDIYALNRRVEWRRE